MQMISHWKAIERNRDCKHKLGAHVQAHDEPEMVDEVTQKEHTMKDFVHNQPPIGHKF